MYICLQSKPYRSAVNAFVKAFGHLKEHVYSFTYLLLEKLLYWLKGEHRYIMAGEMPIVC